MAHCQQDGKEVLWGEEAGNWLEEESTKDKNINKQETPQTKMRGMEKKKMENFWNAWKPPNGNIPRGMEEPIMLENDWESMNTRPGENEDLDFDHSDDNPTEEINVDFWKFCLWCDQG